MFQHGGGFQRLALTIFFVEWDIFRQEGKIAGFFEIGAGGQNQPEVIIAVVVRAVFHFHGISGRAFQRQRVELVHG